MEKNSSADSLIMEPRPPKRKTKEMERKEPELHVFVLSEDGPTKVLESWWTDKLHLVLREEMLKALSTGKFNNRVGPNHRLAIRSTKFCFQTGTIKITAYNEASAIFIAQVVTSPDFSIKMKKNQTVRFGAETVIANKRQVFIPWKKKVYFSYFDGPFEEVMWYALRHCHSSVHLELAIDVAYSHPTDVLPTLAPMPV